PDVERRSPEEERPRSGDLPAAERLELGVADPHRPAVPTGAMLFEPRRLHDPVEGHELDDDEPHVRDGAPGTRAVPGALGVPLLATPSPLPGPARCPRTGAAASR